MRETRSWTVLLVLVLVQVFFGLHYPAAKLLLAEVTPRAWVGLRAAGAALILLTWARLDGRRFPTDPAILGRIAAYSVFGVVINQVCFLEGLTRTTTTHSSMLNTSIPVLTLLFAVALAQERLDHRRTLALSLALVGAMFIISPWAGRPDTVSAPSLTGDLLTLGNALSYSLFLVISKRLLGSVDALVATGLLFGFGSVPLLLWGLPSIAALDPNGLSFRAWLLGLFIIVVPTALAYALTYWALARRESSMVALFYFLQPVVAVLFGVLALGESIDAGFLVGSALIVLAVLLVFRTR